jgi:hypothetical protein
MHRLPKYILLVLFLLIPVLLHAAQVPQEPEKDNKEYLLDLVTNGYNRTWREIWDAGDNRLRLRLGSNNVREWFIEEELKFSAHLLNRLRLRFYHSRLLYYTSKRRSFDTIEFEGRLWGDYYASFFAEPRAEKVDNSIGLAFQRRTAVNRYAVIYFELPRFLNNFTEHHKATSDSVLSVYSRLPVRMGLELRDNITPHVAARLSGYLSNAFEAVNENTFTRMRVPREGGKVKAVSGWVEYVDNGSLPAGEQSAFGIEGAYIYLGKYRNFPGSALGMDLNGDSRESPRERLSGDSSRYLLRESSGSEVQSMDLGSNGVFGEGLVWGSKRCSGENSGAHARGGGGSMTRSPGISLPYIELGEDPFTFMEEDTMRIWSETRQYATPYVWLPVNRMLSINAAVRFERREISWASVDGAQADVTNQYVVPSVKARLELGRRRASAVEGGFIAEYRKRKEKITRDLSILSNSRDDYRDHRLILSYEYHFRPDAILRIIESLDLDREDWGQFSIHDHGFFQMIMGF